ncbi:Uncharacterised protein [Mycobacteroides abscessus subsp. abscessus]|nr:Uncharacterised protein [Mycobacteroides abscessus subsp. abscessus]
MDEDAGHGRRQADLVAQGIEDEGVEEEDAEGVRVEPVEEPEARAHVVVEEEVGGQ